MECGNDDLKRDAWEKLQQLAELSGWEKAIQGIDALINIDAGLQKSDAEVH